jgi:hypothetical protein
MVSWTLRPELEQIRRIFLTSLPFDYRSVRLGASDLATWQRGGRESQRRRSRLESARSFRNQSRLSRKDASHQTPKAGRPYPRVVRCL